MSKYRRAYFDEGNRILMSFELRLILAIFTCYRLAQMIALNDGPFFIFKRIRYWVKDTAYWQAYDSDQINTGNQIDDRYFGKWHNIAEGLACPYCVGIWLSLPLFALLIWPSFYGDWFLILIAISGGQAYLQTQDRR